MPPSTPFPNEGSSLGLSGRQDPMVNGKQGKFQAIGNPCVVIYAAQIVLDHLFGRAQLFVLAPLHNQDDDFHLFRGKPVADAGAHRIFGTNGLSRPLNRKRSP
jgi:hypothetical protein